MRYKVSDTCKDLIVGIVLFSILFAALGGIAVEAADVKLVPYILGVILGAVMAVGMVIHMDQTVSGAIDMEPKAATNYTRNHSLIRLVFVIAVLFLALTFQTVFNIVGVLLGILALKLSAYLQPVTSKYITKTSHSKGR